MKLFLHCKLSPLFCMGINMSVSSLSSSSPPSWSWHLNSYSEFHPPSYYCVNIKPICIQIFSASWICLIISAAVYYRLKKIRNQKIIPRIELSRIGQVLKFEKFSHYVGNYSIKVPFHFQFFFYILFSFIVIVRIPYIVIVIIK